MKSGGRRILYVQYTNPGAYPPLQHSSQLLARSGWNVLFLGTQSLGSDSISLKTSPRIRVRRLRFQAPGLRQKLHYLYFCVWCLWWAARFRPSWIYASDMLACPATLLIRTLCRIPVIYHEHDAPAHRPANWFAYMQFECRRRCARVAHACVIPNAERARIFAAEHEVSNTIVVWNCPAKEDVGPRRLSLDGGLRLLYHGTIGPDLLPVSVVDALLLLPESISLVIVGYEPNGTRGYVAQLLQKASERGVADRIQYLGILSRQSLMEVCGSCDAGLAVFPPTHPNVNLANLLGASNKVFDYLARGLTVIVPALREWEEAFVRPGYAVPAKSTEPSDLALAVSSLYRDPEKVRAMGERGRRRIESEWNYERQFQPVWDLLHGNDRMPASAMDMSTEHACHV